jgi:eukaryotic-like serine/threonine-protein kinase
VTPPGTEALVGGRYRLTTLIAVGGMGAVWKAWDERLQREVAVKLLKPELLHVRSADAGSLTRFRAEARHAAALSHPGIAAVYDYGETDAQAYLVMELVEGEPLVRMLARDGALPVPLAMRIVGLTALALEAAHDAGVIHRDIKPANLIIVRGNGGPSDIAVKVTDFGIARATDSAPLTRTGMVMGTASYLSPEQARAAPVTAASDIYSLGVVGYECLTGVRPFTGATAYAIAAAHAHQPPPPLPDSVPPAVRALIEQALAKNPADRPSSAGELGSAALRLADLAQAPPPRPTATPAPMPTAVLPRVAPVTEVQEVTPGNEPRPVKVLGRRRHRRRLWMIVVLAAIVGAAAALGLTYTGGSGTPSPSPTTSSHALGLSVHDNRVLDPGVSLEAATELQRLGLNLASFTAHVRDRRVP